MIIEAIRYSLTHAPKWVCKMGYLREAIAIDARNARCRVDWQAHIAKTKAAILNAVENCQQNRTILITGAAAINDIPLYELSKIFEQVILLDIVHPFQFKNPFRITPYQYNNIRRISVDITNHMQDLYDNPNILPKVIRPDLYHNFPDIDLVISVNMASQLPVIPLQYLRKNNKKTSHSDKDIDNFAQQIITAHLNWLSGFNCHAAVICDIEWQKINFNGKIINQYDPLYNINIPSPLKTWRWNIAPMGEINKDFCRVNIIGYWMTGDNNIKTT